MPLFSLIIPIYKVEAYLDKCISSVLQQDYANIEIILVDDGSPDNCPAICDAFARKDSRIKVIHKINEGASAARNSGILAATGDYLMFLDADDYWEGANSLMNLANTIEKSGAEVVLYGAKDVIIHDNSTTISRGYYQIDTIRKGKEEAVKSLFETNHFPASAWILTIQRKIVLDHKLFFKTGIKAEDIDWILNVFHHVEKFDAINDTFYMYLKNRPGALTTTSDAKSAHDILYSVQKWMPILEADFTKTNRYLLSFLTYQYITSFIIYSGVSKLEKINLLPVLKSNLVILKYARGKRSLLCKFLIRFFGISLASKIFQMVHVAMNRWPNLKKVI